MSKELTDHERIVAVEEAIVKLRREVDKLLGHFKE